jgi:hypothetical protein
MQCQQQQSKDFFSQEMDFIQAQQKVCVERMQRLVSQPGVGAQTAKRMRQWIEDARFLLSEMGESQSSHL